MAGKAIVLDVDEDARVGDDAGVGPVAEVVFDLVAADDEGFYVGAGADAERHEGEGDGGCYYDSGHEGWRVDKVGSLAWGRGHGRFGRWVGCGHVCCC